MWLTTAYAADHDAYRAVLVSGEPARLSAMIEADKRRLPIDENGVTVLHRALHVYSAQRLEMVRLLIAAGSDVNAVTHEERNAACIGPADLVSTRRSRYC